MATDSIKGLQDELNAALIIINSEIDGVSDLVTTSVSFDLINHYRSAQSDLENRRMLIQQVLDDITKLLSDLQDLENNGYPTPQTFELGAELLDEHKSELSHIEMGAGLFVLGLATHAEIRFGEPVSKTETP